MINSVSSSNNISFSGLKGLSKPENKKNLEMLQKLYGDDFFDTAEDVFSAIHAKSGHNEVYLSTEITDGLMFDTMNFSLCDNKGKKIVSSKYKLGTTPAKYGNKDGMKNALLSLKVSFDEVASSFAKNAGKLDKLINKYS